LTIPNALTVARLLLLPAIAALAYRPDTAGRLWALGLFLTAMATDVIDGLVAKLPGQRSRLGLCLDPVVDKVVLLSLFFVLADLGLVPLWMALGMMAREFLVDGVRCAAALSGKVLGANWMGKTKAVLQTGSIALGLGLWAWAIEPAAASAWTTTVTGVTLVVAWVFAGVFLIWNRALLVGSSGG
jgi:CDP-diacylglycerol--glycerol-3-phosphate 3-phosphatidyltransferase